MKAQHTLGPWRVEKPGYSSHEYYVRPESRSRGGPTIHGSAGAVAKLPPSKFHDQAANARLIAAAPDFLRAALSALESLENFDVSMMPVSLVASIEMLKQAVAKADGVSA